MRPLKSAGAGIEEPIVSRGIERTARPSETGAFAATRMFGFSLVEVFLAFALLTMSVSAALSLDAVAPGSPHSYKETYGDRWSCQHGYRNAGGACTLVTLPANAHLDTSGNRFNCDRGYREDRDAKACTEILVPDRGFLSARSYGSGWDCERGFRAQNGTCVAIVVPRHGFLQDSADERGWECERGFRATADACIPIMAPANGFIDGSPYGTGWDCDRGYRKQADACERIDIPENAFLDTSSYGSGWKCDRGYTLKGGACAALVVPENAHFNHSGNDWDCNEPFKRREAGCALRR